MSDRYSAVPPAAPEVSSRTESRRDGSSAAADQVQRQGKQVADEAKARAEEITNEQMKIGAEHVKQIANAVRAAAEELNDSSPLLAHYARSMSSAFCGISEKMRSESPRQVLKNASDYASREPVAFFGAAVVAGFALSRFLKSSSESSSGSFDPRRDRLGDRTTGMTGTRTPATGSQEM